MAEKPTADFFNKRDRSDFSDLVEPQSEAPATVENDRSLLVPRLVRSRASRTTIRRLRFCAICCVCIIAFPAVTTAICITSYLGGSRNPILLGIMQTVLPTYTYYVENGAMLAAIVRLVDSRSAASYARAQAYYQRQRPLFEAAAKSWIIHPYFAEQGSAPEFQRMGSTLYDTLIARLRVMGQQLRDHKRDDYRVEKDKCATTSAQLRSTSLNLDRPKHLSRHPHFAHAMLTTPLTPTLIPTYTRTPTRLSDRTASYLCPLRSLQVRDVPLHRAQPPSDSASDQHVV